MRGENKSANFACEYDGFLDDMIFKEGVFCNKLSSRKEDEIVVSEETCFTMPD
ncbi:hypothetical protein J4727_12480 [Providencia rettgeri]|uniref:Uncharacterized protein n=1 Tax=Providencia rettgeri TaxID=587 RepID=A0A939SQV4_PRORE|nr:hypothetical protein [Providencia rettgeri]